MQLKPEEQPGLKFADPRSLPSWAHQLAAKGLETEAVITDYFSGQGQYADVFASHDSETLASLAQSFANWSDPYAAQMVHYTIKRLKSGEKLELRSLVRWIMLHTDEPESVIDCINVEPPAQVEIIRVLSRAGSQKLVFEATYRLAQRRVVLKKLTGDPAHNATILARELLSNPLALRHPNIIETQLHYNAQNEPFLVERWVQVLGDYWQCDGLQQAANLLYNLADAVSFLHSKGYVHGDIKPDNIGKEADSFILLDFGICRLIKDFTAEVSATGSLRTRAPELLKQSYKDPTKADVWAIAATVFNSLEGRFPLIERGESVPRVSNPEQRQQFEAELLRRATDEWDQRVTFHATVDPLRKLLQQALERDPESRISAMDLKNFAAEELSAFIRVNAKTMRFSPIDELNQLKSYLPSPELIELMPVDERIKITARLAELKETTGFTPDQRHTISELQSLMNV
jgi:serine/threonine protein kinase